MSRGFGVLFCEGITVIVMSLLQPREKTMSATLKLKNKLTRIAVQLEQSLENACGDEAKFVLLVAMPVAEDSFFLSNDSPHFAMEEMKAFIQHIDVDVSKQ
jgi:hypothetical protein